MYIATSAPVRYKTMSAFLYLLPLVFWVLLLCSWTSHAKAAALGVAPGQSATLLPDGRWLLAGGDGEAAGRSQVLNPGAQQPVALPLRLLTPRSHHSATVLPDGRVLIFGGVGKDGGVVRNAELLDPQAQSSSDLGDIGVIPRTAHTATVLMDGSVLIAGGVSSKGVPVVQGDLWDPVAKQALGVRAQMAVPREGHTAQLLPDEPVLISGGRDAAGNAVATPEFYFPRQQRFDLAPSALASLSQSNTDAPQVRDSQPADNATGVPISSRIAVSFSKPLSVTSLNSKTVTLLGPTGSVSVNVVPVEQGRLLFVTPQADLQPGARYTLFINAAVDEAGNPLPFTAIGFTAGNLSGGTGTGASSIGSSSTSAQFNQQTSVQAGNSAAVAAQTPSALQPALAQGAATQLLAALSTQHWIPAAAHLRGDWRVKLPASPLQKLPPLAAAPGVTALAGQVLLMNGEAAVGVTLKLDGQTTHTDATGRFLIPASSPGAKTLIIDGTSANRPGRAYGYFEVLVLLEGGKTTPLPYTSWMPLIDTAHTVKFDSPTRSEVVITTPYIPQLEVHIPKGTVLRDRSGRVINELSITPIPIDRSPYPLPTRYVPVYFTLQPGGARIQGVDAASAQGARVIYPNYHHDAPGSVLDFWNYDPVQKGWYVYGQGKIAADGQQIVPNPGVSIYELTGAMVSRPSNAPDKGPPPGGCSDAPGGSKKSTPGPAAPENPSPDADPLCPKKTDPPDPESTPSRDASPKDGKGAPSPAGCGGDPVDCYTGLFLHTRTDLTVRGTVPLSITRTYRQGDSVSRAFGIGTNHPYDIFTVGDTFPYTYQDLILADGGRIHFVRTSPGTGYTDAVYAHTATPTAYYGAVITWANGRWQLKMRDGRTMYFADCAGCVSSRLAALTEFDDRLGNKIMLTRDAAGNLTQVSNPDGRYISLTYDSSNRVTQATDNIGRAVAYQYDANGRLAQATDADGGVERYSYDASNNMLTVTKPNGQLMVTNQYDANTRVSQQTLADGGVYKFAYTLDTNGNAVQADVTDPRGNVRRMRFNSSGYVTSATNALGLPEAQTTTFERQAGTNFLLSQTDSLGRKTGFTYDTAGNLTAISYLAGTSQAVTKTYAYEPAFNQVVSYTDELGHTTSFTYDSSGNRIAVTDPLGNATKFSYNGVGQVIGITNAMRNASSLSYIQGDLVAVTDQLGRTFKRYTDGVGRLLSITDPLGNMSSWDYNGRSLPVKHTDAKGGVTTFAYDVDGNLTSLTDARGNQTSFGYDEKDRLVTQTDPLLHNDRFSYDSTDNLTQVTDRNGKVTTFAYDGLSRRTATAYGQTLTGGQLGAPDATVTSTFDMGNRVTQIADSVGGSISRTYDSLDRLIGETSQQGSISYSYDSLGRRTSQTVSGQTAVGYVYDNANRLIGISRGSAQVGFTYDASSRRTTLTLPNGIVANYTYDAANQLTGMSFAKGDSQLGNLTYTYDTVGRRIQMGGSLANMALPNATTGATYDANNRLASWQGVNLTYDNNGNLLSDGSLSYAWDSRNRLSSLSGAATASFTYDAIGRRSGKTVGSTEIGLFYDGQNVVQELSGSSPSANLLTGGIDEVFSRTDALMGTRHFVTDALGSTMALTDDGGSIKTTYAYEPFGAATASGEVSNNAIQYTGRENDGTGLYYYRARYYHPRFMRFISSDPIGFAGGINTYAYVGGSPIGSIDPSGLSTIGYDGNSHNIVVTSGSGTPLASFPANNNTTATSNGPWPNGVFPFSHSNPHPESGVNGPYGSHGILVFNVPGRSGMGLHSGRANSGAQDHPTLGCIRTTDEAMQFVRELNLTDPVTSIRVINNNPNAPQFGGQQ
ncbi:RHS repeat-associated core domain-containing protein [Ralstonia sp. NFACC01]|uniref:RHS repeat-associated core domain-containing protein n=1 Tax=Ralstonia sp. NFACC01 TaxID=1566294 RepID=UPI0008F0C6CC|nr:RHS repeat-associated core domain-containing protein [Ralstonia sp. NFACC01]SFQ19572.1 RHS repeat-associated core domain-containing protein [Ralstonia sp. NFACC01]